MNVFRNFYRVRIKHQFNSTRGRDTSIRTVVWSSDSLYRRVVNLVTTPKSNVFFTRSLQRSLVGRPSTPFAVGKTCRTSQRPRLGVCQHCQLLRGAKHDIRDRVFRIALKYYFIFYIVESCARLLFGRRQSTAFLIFRYRRLRYAAATTYLASALVSLSRLDGVSVSHSSSCCSW